MAMDRRSLARRLAAQYAAGASIRALAAEHGRSYGWARSLLLAAGCRLRPTGGRYRPRRVASDAQVRALLAERYPPLVVVATEGERRHSPPLRPAQEQAHRRAELVAALRPRRAS